ncbi:MAG: protein kinase [Acidobacteriia bacterium]|nr:protein kinase [Terriglobia bacterium]
MKELIETGTTFSHYRILSPLGSGGMGEVYLAEDDRLGRKVALKLLPVEYIQDQERMHRFEQEARAASALNHPNIITIFDVGRAENVHFIATEFIEGSTLRQYLAKAKLSLRDAVDVAVQVAGALSAAHRVGIVHRDIKPENIMLRPDGYVKVLDFGLAKLTEPTPSDSESPTRATVQTETGVVVGTVSYMSPEQVRGVVVDARTDLFSLGVVLYEMVAGIPPFEGGSKSELIAAILDREPPPLARYARDVPNEVERIVSKALRKDRELRYQTARDVQIDLKSLKEDLEFEAKRERVGQATSSGTQAIALEGEPAAVKSGTHPLPQATSSAEYLVTEIKRHKKTTFLVLALLILAASGVIYVQTRSGKTISSLAVLPFVNVTADPNSEYIPDGITESLINRLAQLPNLTVMSRSSVFRYKGREPDVQEAGRQLKVQAVLTGRVVQRGDDLDISAELVDVHNNSHLWGEQYHRKLSDILTLQSDIAREISEKLKLRLTGAEKDRLAKNYTENTEAYQLYLKGRYHAAKFTEDGLARGLNYFNQAIAIDPSYALAYDGVAYYYVTAADWFMSPREAMPKAKAALQTALRIDNALSEAHTSLAIVSYWYEYDWATAERELKRALELNPNDASAHQFYGSFLAWTGRVDAGIREANRAIELDPLSPQARTYLGVNLFFARRYDEAVKQLEEVTRTSPNYWWAHVFLGRSFAQTGRLPEAIAEFQSAKRIEDAISEIDAALGHAYALSGRKSEAEKVLEELKQRSMRSYVSPYNMAVVCAGLGEKDAAFQWLDKAYDERPFYLTWLEVDPDLDILRSDPRFSKLLRRVGFKR